MGYDIFISYRRSDAEAYARMLYNDLTANGYDVFYDFKSLGGGDYLDAVRNAIDECEDFIVLLSKDCLGSRIMSENDVVHKEIAYALQQGKRIVGIMLSGFDSFPTLLPADLAKLPRINCLNGKLEFYDFMFEKLISGSFLLSAPHQFENKKSMVATVDSLNDSLSWFRAQPVEKKQKYMKFMLDLAHEFNYNAAVLRVYEYLDKYFRTRGVGEIGKYKGNIPTDFATYLAFFEDLYLITITETVDISLIDEGYRFRFFAGVNNPEIQNSELLELGYQYPRIFSLYEYWSEYIRKKNLANSDRSDLYDAFPGFERDLLITNGLFTFAQKQQPISIRFINKSYERKDCVFKRLFRDQASLFMNFQNKVLDSISENAERNIFEPLTKEEIEYSVEHDICTAVFDEGNLIAILSLIFAPQPSQNILLDLPEFSDINDNEIMIIDCVLVLDGYRGFGLQRAFLRLADFYAKKYGASVIGAVVSPENSYSENNFIRSGYRLVLNRPKYHSTRDYFVKEI